MIKSNRVRDAVKALRAEIEIFPPTRERSLALTKLEECELWFQAMEFSIDNATVNGKRG